MITEEVADSAAVSRLDTLPEAVLRRMVERWSGRLESRAEAADSAGRISADTAGGGGASADSFVSGAVPAAHAAWGEGNVASADAVRVLAERWRKAREPYRDADASAVFGAESSPAEVAVVTEASAGGGAVFGAEVSGDAAAERVSEGCGVASVAADTAGMADGQTLRAAATDTAALSSAGPLPEASPDTAAQDSVPMFFGDSAQRFSAATPAVHAAQAEGAAAVVPAGRGYRGGAAATDEWFSAWGGTAQNGLTVVAVLLYLFCLYRYFDDVAALFGSVFRRSVTPSERIMERRRSEIFYGFLGKLFLLGLLFVGVLAAKWAMCAGADALLPARLRFFLPLAATGAFFAVVAVQYAALAAAGAVTRSFSTMTALLRIRLIYFVLATVLVAPLLLVSLSGTGRAYDVWFAAGCAAAVTAFALFVRESLTLFVSKKISILHWFLYLCIVEIMPFSILWQVIVRLRQ